MFTGEVCLIVCRPNTPPRCKLSEGTGSERSESDLGTTKTQSRLALTRVVRQYNSVASFLCMCVHMCMYGHDETLNHQVCCFRNQDLATDREYIGRPDGEKDSATISPSWATEPIITDDIDTDTVFNINVENIQTISPSFAVIYWTFKCLLSTSLSTALG